MNKKFIILLFLMIFSAVLVSCSSAPDLSCPECNLIIINTELLRADFVGLLNDGSNATPNIDNFFSDGVIFEDVSAPAGETYSSITAIFRGQESAELSNHLFDKRMFEPNAPLTIAEVLSSNGWGTSYIDEGFQSGKTVYVDSGFNYYRRLFPYSFINDSRLDFLTVLRFKKKEAFLLRNKGFYPPQYVHYHIDQLHYPYYFYPDRISFTDLNKSFIKFYDNTTLRAMNMLYKENDSFYVYDVYESASLPWIWLPKVFTKSENYSIKEMQILAAPKILSYWYAKNLNQLDDNLKLIFDYLESSGYVNNSIIILYANHGEALGENNIFRHGQITQATIHVPLFIKHPNIHKQIRIRTPVSLVDLSATIFDFFGIKHVTSGFSLVPLIEGGVYSRSTIFGSNEDSSYIRKGDWKLIDWGAYVTLVNISADPQEVVDVSLLYPNITLFLREKLISSNLLFRSRSYK